MLPLGAHTPPIEASKSREPDPPSRSEFASDRQYIEACEVWMSKHYGAEDHTRDIKDEYGDHHTTGYDQLLPTKAEQEARRAAYNVHRFATGIASTSERIRAYGYDLRQAENIARAYEAIYEQLDDAAKGR